MDCQSDCEEDHRDQQLPAGDDGGWCCGKDARTTHEARDWSLTGVMLQDCQYWLAYLGMQCRLHELRHKRRISVAAASKILANLVYSYKGMGLSMGTMCAGVTPTEGPALYYIDSDGTRLAGDRFCVGSGQTFAYGVLDAEYSYDLSDEDARELGKRSILAATHRDAFSGGYINLYHVKEQGWEVSVHIHDPAAEVSALTIAETWLHGHQSHLLGDEAHQGRILQRHGKAGVGWVSAALVRTRWANSGAMTCAGGVAI